MSTVGQKEAATQARVIELLRKQLGYRYLGNWGKRAGNSNVEEENLTAWLSRQGHDEAIVQKALRQLNQVVGVAGNRMLYQANREVYGLLRYGIKVQPSVDAQHVTVWLIDWQNPENNDFAVAEEVTVSGENVKRPDIVLYVNGIALGVLELKRSIVSVEEGIRQNLDNQRKEFIQHFFSTIQLIMAGNDTEGLRYGVIQTPEKYYLEWREESDIANPLDRALSQLCRKERLLETVHDFIVFDAGTKKVCRHNQYFGMRAAQDRVRRREGGIIWHTQGSGKSLTMIWLAKWIRENVPNARVLIITDRTELDEQIEKFFLGVDETIYQTTSGADLMRVLNATEPWLMCSLIHKFGRSDDDADIDAYLQDIQKQLPTAFQAKGELFVFVDECHRSQSGKLHDAMKAIMPSAMLIGFTGTPLLKKDKKSSIEVFGPYIHTYRYDEAVRDGVVLDLRYEARDIDQDLTSPERVDQWFESKTRGLTDVARAQLKQRWGTMRSVLSSKDRLDQIVSDILFDMETRDRLRSDHGNALLVCDSVYAACRLFESFHRTHLKGKCAVVTSYRPAPSNIKGEETGEGLTEELRKYEAYRRMLADYYDEDEDAAMHKAEQFEREAKRLFVNEPGQMKLLIVVDKLLTGFDAPPATYLYIDKAMRDHGLFQAICRVNRLHTPDKEYGYIVDYKDLFRSLEASIKDYTGEAFDGFDEDDVAGLLKDRLEQARKRLEETREAVKAACEYVQQPRDTTAYIAHFCTRESDDADAVKDNERKRVVFYRLTASFVRAYANLANEMAEAGYTPDEAEEIRQEVEHYESVREEVKLASGDYVDMKVFEPAMRHLLDTYIRAKGTDTVAAFDDMSLVDLLAERGEAAMEQLPESIRESEDAMAETIENNVRRVIIDQMAVNPKYYELMSELLDELIQARKQQALEYKAYLREVVALAKQVKQPDAGASRPASINTAALRALYDNLEQNEDTALQVDEVIRTTKKADWRGNRFKEREIRGAISSVLGDDAERVDAIFEIVRNQSDY